MDFSVLKIKKNKLFEDYNDDQLVRLAQEDILKFRSNCDWYCDDCGCKVSYSKSLKDNQTNYVHDLKCEPCSKKMILRERNKKEFHSAHFNEIFARYQDMIIQHSVKSGKYIDSPDEVYSFLCSAFLKIVAMFDLDSSLKKTSEKWFSSFVWKSLRNKLFDLKKTNSYHKRTPLVQCHVCRERLGQITVKHLLEEGHEVILEKILFDYGVNAMKDSGEYQYYDCYSDEYHDRCLYVGAMAYASMEKKERKQAFEKDCIRVYNAMFPDSYFRNSIVSINTPIDEDSGADIEDFNNDSVLGRNYNVADDLNLKGMIDNLVSIFYKGENYKVLNKFFNEDLTKEEKKQVISSIVYDKSNFSKISNSELDETFDYVKPGLSSEIFRLIKQNKDCMEMLRCMMIQRS